MLLAENISDKLVAPGMDSNHNDAVQPLNAAERRATIIQEDCSPQTVMMVRRVVLTRSARTIIFQAVGRGNGGGIVGI